MNKSTQLLCAHSGFLFTVLLAGGIFGVAGWLPPYDPGHTAQEVAEMFSQHTLRIRIGMTLLALGSVFWWPFAAAISMQMRRMEGASHPLTYVQMAAASGGVLAVLFPAYFWLMLAYRPGTVAPETMQMMNDLSWLAFVGMYPPGLLQNLAIGICILAHPEANHVYPRWLAFANLWIAFGFIAGALLPFFHGGPFAWNGVIGFWLVATVFFAWIFLMWYMTCRAIRAQPADSA